MVCASPVFVLWADRRFHLRRVVEMAEEFPHVKFNALDIGGWSVTCPPMVPHSEISM